MSRALDPQCRPTGRHWSPTIRSVEPVAGATGLGLPPGVLTVSAAATRSSSESTVEKRTLGYYIEEVL